MQSKSNQQNNTFSDNALAWRKHQAEQKAKAENEFAAKKANDAKLPSFKQQLQQRFEKLEFEIQKILKGNCLEHQHCSKNLKHVFSQHSLSEILDEKSWFSNFIKTKYKKQFQELLKTIANQSQALQKAIHEIKWVNDNKIENQFYEFRLLIKEIQLVTSKLRERLLNKVLVHISKLYSVMDNSIPSELSFLNDLTYFPAISYSGKLFNRFNSHIAFPIDANSELNDLIWPLRNEKTRIENGINKINCHEDYKIIETAIANFKENCIKVSKQIDTLKEKVKTETNRKAQEKEDIINIINNLKLNSLNPQHVAFWQSKVKLGGGKNPFKVPDRIYRMMLEAGKVHSNKTILVNRLNIIRQGGQPGDQRYSWADYRLFKNLRDDSTKALYEAKDISEFKVR